MPHTLQSLADRVNGRLIGDGAVLIRGVNHLDAAVAGDIIFAGSEQGLAQALKSKASAIIVPLPVADLADGRSGIAVENPKLAFARLLEMFYPEPADESAVHPSSVVAASAVLGERVTVGANVTIGERARIGRGTVIRPGVVIGDDVTIGEQCFVGPNVSMYRKTIIGSRVRIHGGSVIGADGFGYILHDGRHVKVPQVGNVIIEDDVELGACVCVDRATVGSTLIRQGTKVDNQVQIAHNDQIGRHVILCGQVGLAGSVEIGDYSVLGGKVGVSDHVKLGEQFSAGGGSIVFRNFQADESVWGYPARPLKEMKEQMAILNRLPSMWATLKKLVKKAE